MLFKSLKTRIYPVSLASFSVFSGCFHAAVNLIIWVLGWKLALVRGQLRIRCGGALVIGLLIAEVFDTFFDMIFNPLLFNQGLGRFINLFAGCRHFTGFRTLSIGAVRNLGNVRPRADKGGAMGLFLGWSGIVRRGTAALGAWQRLSKGGILSLVEVPALLRRLVVPVCLTRLLILIC